VVVSLGIGSPDEGKKALSAIIAKKTIMYGG
jgi:hypothetical protein